MKQKLATHNSARKMVPLKSFQRVTDGCFRIHYYRLRVQKRLKLKLRCLLQRIKTNETRTLRLNEIKDQRIARRRAAQGSLQRTPTSTRSHSNPLILPIPEGCPFQSLLRRRNHRQQHSRSISFCSLVSSRTVNLVLELTVLPIIRCNYITYIVKFFRIKTGVRNTREHTIIVSEDLNHALDGCGSK